ncbi:Mitochondrial carrier protein MTM1 [Vitis vinifera]|uniref:Mitochondrial carrier protein MTM1 n=1 Tax=Vitis vinifera TaxID=29760 RepID=A0A438DP05_VITVI|nr:Mitochondrial carrier protein MTM1 [Vitis vinifera]
MKAMTESENRGKLWMSTQQSSPMDLNGHDSAMSAMLQSTVTFVAEASSPETQRSKSKSENDMRFLERSFSAAGAAVLSAILVNPLDVAKTRLQAQAAGVPYSHPLSNVMSRMAYFGPNMLFADLRCSPSCPRVGIHGTVAICPPDCFQYKGTWDVFYKIIRQGWSSKRVAGLDTNCCASSSEGFARLWRGTNAGLALAVPTVGIYLPCYDIFRNRLEEFTAQNAPTLTVYVPLVAGSLARSLACATCYPIELARTRMQAFKEIHGGKKPAGVFKTLVEVVSHFKSTNNVQSLRSYRVLWTGIGAQLARDVPFSAICWSTLEPMRRKLLSLVGEDANAASVLGANFSAGFVSGSLAAAATCPLDVAKTRRQIEFSDCLGMPTKGFKMEILTLLTRMKIKKEQKAQVAGSSRVRDVSSRFDRELRRLECTVKFKGSDSGRGKEWEGREKVIMSLIKSQRVDLVCLQETKVQEMSNGLVRSLGVGRFPMEWNKSSRLSSTMRRFSEIIEELELRDLPLQGGFLLPRESLLPRTIFDHHPILLDKEGVRNGPSHFSFILAEKLKALKSFLKIWNKEVFGNVSSRKDFALNQVMFWDSMEGTRPSSIEKQIARQLVREEYKKDFHEQGRFVKSLNASFLVLIPKKGRAEDLKDYKPISLVGSLYKLLAKVLANRLKKVSNTCGLICKLDIEKTYDHVNWNFLLLVLNKMGFGDKWVRWIKWCISIVSFSVIVNDSPLGFFQSSRRLRVRVRGREGEKVSHLLFADDILVFCEPSEGRWENIEELAQKFGCKVGALPSFYLGLPLGASFKSISVWEVEVAANSKEFSLGRRGLGAETRLWYSEERGAFWQKEISRKYGEDEGGWHSCEVRDRTSFPSLFVLVASKGAWVEEVWSASFDGGCWAPCFSKHLNDWEMDIVEWFLLRLQEWRNDPARALRMTTRQTLLEVWRMYIGGEPLSILGFLEWLATRNGGMKGLFTGAGPRVARAGPSVGIVVSFYEVVKYGLHHQFSTS